ncbi:MAG: fatty acid desaturase [Legionellaceae bacterium]|nr:fatty acid desaturase [Legionellaceae bacterium]
MFSGLLHLSLGGYILTTLCLTQITIAANTLYLHRCQAHRAITLHPVISHFFRFWLWLTTGTTTAEWVAVHRKHHAFTDKEGDPHSPQIEGINSVLWGGWLLYRKAAQDPANIQKYAHDAPNDWIENHLYGPHLSKAIWILLVLNFIVFGIPGIFIWMVQMLWIPFHAAGVINGLAHYFGYRNFPCPDASRNLFPLALWIGGEELHNNHHAYASSAKFSIRWWEIDIGWCYIRCLQFFKLAQVKKLPPKIEIQSHKKQVDLETVKVIVHNRLKIMGDYYTQVLRPMIQEETKRSSLETRKNLQWVSRLLRMGETILPSATQEQIQQLLKRHQMLNIAYDHRCRLQQLWSKTVTSQKELIEKLQEWCKHAEVSGIESLQQFAKRLTSYTMSKEPLLS